MNETRSPFDGKMILAIVAVMLLWFGWNSHLQNKYPEHFKKQAGQPAETAAPAPSGESAPPAIQPADKVTAAHSAVEQAEKTFGFDHENWSFVVSSKGMAIKDIKLKHYTDRQDEAIYFAGGQDQGSFSTNIVGRAKPLDFTVTQPEPDKFVGVAQVGQTKIVKTIIVDSSNYTFKQQIRAENLDENFSGIVNKVSQHVVSSGGGSIFAPRFDHYELFVGHDGTYERHVFAVDESFSQNFENPIVTSIASQYFALAAVDASDIKPELKVTAVPKGQDEAGYRLDVDATMTYMVPAGATAFAVNSTAFAGPKSFELLQSIHSDLANVVNFGFFQSIGKLIFKLMHAIHAVTGNWGLAIVLLTILVRILVLPFNMMSYRSMKGMAKIQPQIKLLRERYKDNPQKLNEEMLKLMKEAKANPLGGCLPMLLQIPVFFALYQVLGQSIELYKAPFIWWIQDLSDKDPFYILPALMGITLFVQQKITPNTMEPAQQKVMQFLPLLFTFMMIGLPSGLTLYIFVSGLFGVLQQLYFMRDEVKREGIRVSAKS